MTPKRYLGIEVGGSKRPRTSIAAIEYYEKEQKAFLLNIQDRLGGHPDISGDDELIEAINSLLAEKNTISICVNVPLEFPPCIRDSTHVCPGVNTCDLPEVVWMREWVENARRDQRENRANPAYPLVRDFTSYTQRAVELFVRYAHAPEFLDQPFLESEETLGSNLAPLAARMHYLKGFLKSVPLLETWPKLDILLLGKKFKVSRKAIENYRKPETGEPARAEILEVLSSELGIFLYTRDIQTLTQSLTAFDAFICAIAGLLQDLGRTVTYPAGFPTTASKIVIPK